MDAFAKRKAMDFGEEVVSQDVDALDKVRMFLESQNTLGAIAERTPRNLKKPKRRGTSTAVNKSSSKKGHSDSSSSLSLSLLQQNELNQLPGPSGFSRQRGTNQGPSGVGSLQIDLRL